MSVKDEWILASIKEYRGNDLSKFSSSLVKLILLDQKSRLEVLRSMSPKEKNQIFQEITLLDEDVKLF